MVREYKSQWNRAVADLLRRKEISRIPKKGTKEYAKLHDYYMSLVCKQVKKKATRKSRKTKHEMKKTSTRRKRMPAKEVEKVIEEIEEAKAAGMKKQKSKKSDPGTVLAEYGIEKLPRRGSKKLMEIIAFIEEIMMKK